MQGTVPILGLAVNICSRLQQRTDNVGMAKVGSQVERGTALVSLAVHAGPSTQQRLQSRVGGGPKNVVVMSGAVPLAETLLPI